MAWMEVLDTAVYFEAAGPADGRPVLLLHELGGSHASWKSLVGLLEDCHCVAIDFPGAGKSEKRRGNGSIAELAAVACAVMRRLRPEGAWSIVGSALGSFVALELARAAPELVGTLTVCAVAPAIDTATATYLRERVERIRREGMAAVTRPSLANSLTPDLPLPGEAFRRDYEYAFRCQDPDGYGLLSLALADFAGGGGDLKNVRVPTLVMAGMHDFIWPPALVGSVADAIPGAEFHVLADGGHFAHLQCPHSFAARMGAFWNGPARS